MVPLETLPVPVIGLGPMGKPPKGNGSGVPLTVKPVKNWARAAGAVWMPEMVMLKWELPLPASGSDPVALKSNTAQAVVEFTGTIVSVSVSRPLSKTTGLPSTGVTEPLKLAPAGSSRMLTFTGPGVMTGPAFARPLVKPRASTAAARIRLERFMRNGPHNRGGSVRPPAREARAAGPTRVRRDSASAFVRKGAPPDRMREPAANV